MQQTDREENGREQARTRVEGTEQAAARGKAPTDAASSGHAWRRRLIIASTVLAFIAIGSVALYGISFIVGAVILLIFSALLAYLIYPFIQLLQRRLPHPLAIAVAYLAQVEK